jgi:hypothetical protein
MNKLSLLALIGTGLSFLILLHSLWQVDLICVRPVWQTSEWIPYFRSLNVTNYSDYYPFQCGFWFRTTVGNAYDLYLGMAIVSWFVLLVSLFYLFYNERQKVNRLKKEILYLKETSRISSSEGQ